MKFVSDYLGFPKQLEICLLIAVAMICAVSDKSLVEVRSNLKEVWTLSLDPYKFPPMRQIFLKYVISSVVLIRTFTLHPHLACLVIMLWPACLEDRPSLLLPWLGVGAARYLLADTIAMVTGLYFYCIYGVLNMRNVEYLLVQFIEHGPAFYMWCCVYSFYNELTEETYACTKPSSMDPAERRRRARSLMSTTNMRHYESPEDYMNFLSSTILLGVIHPFQRQFTTNGSRSIDALLALRAAQEQQEEILNIEFESTSSGTCKPEAGLLMKALGISNEDVIKAKRNKPSRMIMHFSKEDVSFDDIIEKKLFISHSDTHLLKNKILNNLFLNSDQSSFTSSMKIRKIPECINIRELKDGNVSNKDTDEQTVEEMEQLLSDDMLSDDNYITKTRTVSPKMSRTFSYIVNLSEESSKAIPKSRSLIESRKLRQSDAQKSRNELLDQPITKKNNYNNNKKPKVSLNLPKGNTVEQKEFFRNDGAVKKTKNIIEPKQPRPDRKKTASYNKIKQKAEAMSYINSVSSGATSKYKAKYSKDSTNPQDHSDKSSLLKRKNDSSCQVSTLSRKVLNNPQSILVKK